MVQLLPWAKVILIGTFPRRMGQGDFLGRNEARRQLNLQDFKRTMRKCFLTTTVNRDTLDEAPDAYKSMDDIIEQIGDTATSNGS